MYLQKAARKAAFCMHLNNQPCLYYCFLNSSAACFTNRPVVFF